jgi:MFS family permease
MLVAALVLFVALRPDPLLVAREVAEVSVVQHSSWRRAFELIRERPVLGAAIVVLAGAHAAMVMVMVMTPLHMEHGGAELEIIGVVLSVHVLGMFAFAPLVGMLADRVGRAPTAMAGATLLLLALTMAASSPEGTSWQVFAGLFLLGLGWSFSTVAGSTLLTDHAPLDARTDLQGLADLVMGVVAAGASALSGLIVAAWGFPALSLVACLLPTAVGIAAYAAARSRTVPVRM